MSGSSQNTTLLVFFLLMLTSPLWAWGIDAVGLGPALQAFGDEMGWSR